MRYTEDQLKRHSWAFWFKQISHDATAAVGNFINSRTDSDSALVAMKAWHAVSTRDKYGRDNSAVYRSPRSNSLPEIVALMKKSRRRPRGTLELPTSYRDTLTDPIGLTSVSGISNCNAPDWGWRNTEHSDMKNREFYLIYAWFDDVFKKRTNIIK